VIILQYIFKFYKPKFFLLLFIILNNWTAQGCTDSILWGQCAENFLQHWSRLHLWRLVLWPCNKFCRLPGAL